MKVLSVNPDKPRGWYSDANVPVGAIRHFARRVAEYLVPNKIVIFGSHDYGTSGEDGDVEILVVMPARNQVDQALPIRLEVPAPFAMDLIVRTPSNRAGGSVSRRRSGNACRSAYTALAPVA